MTTTTTDLKRWLKLFEKDETLRPKHLKWDPEWGWMIRQPFKELDDFRLPIAEDSWNEIVEEGAEALIRDAAIRWFNTKHEGLTIGDGHFDENYRGSLSGGGFFGGFSVRVHGPMIDVTRSGDALIDALYEAVVAVMEEDERQDREARKRNSLLGRFKRSLGLLWNRHLWTGATTDPPKPPAPPSPDVIDEGHPPAAPKPYMSQV